MPVTIPTRNTPPRYRLSAVLDGVELGLRLYWLPRAAGWFLDALDASGAAVATGIRVTPAAPLALPGAAAGLPPGRLIATGPDSYAEADLGVQVQLVYLTAADLEAAGGA